MDDAICEIITRSAAETLENLAFMFAFADGDVPEPEEEEARVCQVSFTGPFSGLLRIFMSKQCLPELAANMLGYDDPSQASAAEQTEALKETANIICGNLLPLVSDPKAVFQVASPEMALPGAGHPPEMNLAGRAALSLDEGSCLILLYVEKNAVLSPGEARDG